MIRPRGVSSLVLGAVSLFAAAAVQASDLYAVEFSGATPLFKLDDATAAINSVGPATLTDVGDLASDPRPGQQRIWGVVLPSTDDDLENSLVSVDPANGALTGSLQITGLQGNNSKITSIAFDPVTDTLYGNTTVSFGDTGSRLYRIDPATGAAALVDDILDAGGQPFSDIFALGFDQTGRLFGIADFGNELIEIDPATGTASFIATLPIASSYDIAARPEDNLMFVTSTATQSLYTVDTATGSLDLIGSHGGNLVGLAFVVPEPATWAVMLGGIGALVAFVRRRNRPFAYR